jgi:rRNA processing protein Gar1
LTEAYDSKNKLLLDTELGEIGEVMHLAKSGRLIVKLNATSAGIKPGELLVDAAGRRVGKIVELLGPVSSPYASVIPMTDRTARLAGAKVFAGGQARPPRPRQQQEKGRRRR